MQEMNETMFDKLGGRKFILAVLGLIALVLLAVFKPEAISAELITGILGLAAMFNASNTVTTVKGLVAAGGSAPVPPQPPSGESVQDYVKVELLNMQQQLDEAKVQASTATNQVNALADIILKLTSTVQGANVNTVPNERTQPNAAESNRQAISNYLKQNFG